MDNLVRKLGQNEDDWDRTKKMGRQEYRGRDRTRLGVQRKPEEYTARAR